MCVGGTLGKFIMPTPVDPITTKLAESGPKPLRATITAPTRALKALVGRETASKIIDPLSPREREQTKTFLGG